jgi:hypothetical protein
MTKIDEYLQCLVRVGQHMADQSHVAIGRTSGASDADFTVHLRAEYGEPLAGGQGRDLEGAMLACLVEASHKLASDRDTAAEALQIIADATKL